MAILKETHGHFCSSSQVRVQDVLGRERSNCATHEETRTSVRDESGEQGREGETGDMSLTTQEDGSKGDEGGLRVDPQSKLLWVLLCT